MSGPNGQGYEYLVREREPPRLGWDVRAEGLGCSEGEEGGSEALEAPSRCLSGCEVQGYDEPSSREND